MNEYQNKESLQNSNERKNLDTAHFGSIEKNFLSFENNTNSNVSGNQGNLRMFKSTNSSIPNQTGNFNTIQSNGDQSA